MEQKEIDLKELITILTGRILLIALSGIGLSLAAFLLSKYAIEPQYEATTKIYVLSKQDNETAITYNDLQTVTQLAKDYMALITSRPVTEKVIEELELEMKPDDLADHISVSNPTDTRILEITVNYNNPTLAKEIANASREISKDYIAKIMKIEKVNVVEEAEIPQNPSDPNIILNTLLGGVLGIITAIFIVLIKYFMNDTIKTPDDIEKYLGLSVLTTIPFDNNCEDIKTGKSVRKKTRKQIKQTKKGTCYKNIKYKK